jgi:hypothetical protein
LISNLRERRLAAALASTLALSASAAAQTTVSGGPAFDYQASVVQPWGDPEVRIVVFERLTGDGFEP